MIHGLLGDVDLAFDWLDQAIRHREPTILWMKYQPRMACLQRDRRFAANAQAVESFPCVIRTKTTAEWPTMQQG